MNRSPRVLAAVVCALAAGLPMAPAARAGLMPETGSPYAAGRSTFAVATGDFNADGLADLAAPAEDSDDVTVLLRLPGGGYAPAPGSPFAAGERPADAVAADFDGDGRDDLALADFGRQGDGDTVTVLIAQPDGGFVPEPGSPITVGTGPTSVAAADVNDDHLPDLVVTTQLADAVTILLRRPGGGFTEEADSPLAVGSAPFETAVGDFNGDHRPDLAVSNQASGDVTVLMREADGGYVQHATLAAGTQPLGITAADFDGDGDDDLAFANFQTDDVFVALSDGEGNFTPEAGSPIKAGDGVYGIAAADFDGDHRPDLAVSSEYDHLVTIWHRLASGGFRAGDRVPLDGEPVRLVADDLDGNGRADLAVAVYTSSHLAVFRNAPETAITAHPPAVTNDPTPTFAFVADDPAATFECRVDAAPFRACSAPHTTAPLDPGAHTFAVRAVVGAVADPTPASFDFSLTTPTPTPTPSGSPSPAPVVARFDAPARVPAWRPVTLDASASTGAASYRWDLDGDGRADVDCGDQPRVTVRFAPSHGAETVGLTIGPSATATDSISVDGPQLSLAAARYGDTAFCDGLDPSHNTLDATANGGPRAGCNFGVTFGLVQAIGCLYRVNTQVGHLDQPVLRAIALLYAEDPEYRAYVNAASAAAGLANPDGNGLLNPKEVDTALQVSDFYVSTSAVRINGLDFTPRHGSDLVLAPVLQRIIAEDSVVALGGATVRQGRFVLDVSVKKHRVDVGEVDLTGQLPSIGSFPLTRQAHVAFISPGASDLGVHIRPPSWTRLLIDDGAAPTFDATVRITNTSGFDVRRVDAQLRVLSFGSWRLGDVNVGYRKFDDHGSFVDRWQITGTLTLGALGDDGIYLTPPPLYGILFEHARFKSAGVEVEFDTVDAPHIFPGVALQKLGAHLELDPSVFIGTTTLRVLGVADVNGKLIAALPSPDAPYRLGSAFSGMPAAIANQDFTAPVFAVGGTTSIRNFQLGDGYFVYAYPDRIALGGGIDRNFFDILRLYGHLDGAFNLSNGRFNLVGQVEGCLFKNSICGGATAVISSQGAGGCIHAGPISVGGGVQWPSKVYVWPLDGCKWSRFTEDHVFAKAAQAGAAHIVHIAHGEPSRAIRIDGTGDAPAVKVTAPNGETLASTAASGAAIGRHLRILRSTEHKLTVIGLQDPAPGDYTIEPLPGSATWAHTATAQDPPDSRIVANLRGHGAHRTLRYTIRRRPDQRVTLVARNPAGSQTLGTITGGGRGTLHFAPRLGAGTYRVVAEVELAGLPAEQRELTRFRDRPVPERAARPQPLALARRSHTLEVRWGSASRAARYSVTARERGGAVRHVLTRGDHATVDDIAPSQGGTVSVRALDAFGHTGPARRATFRAIRRPATRFARYQSLNGCAQSPLKRARDGRQRRLDRR